MEHEEIVGLDAEASCSDRLLAAAVFRVLWSCASRDNSCYDPDMSLQFFVRLLPPRPSFIQDMTPEERDLMGQHAVYTRHLFDAGKVLAYGPVLDPQEAFGMAVFEVETEDEVKELLGQDPTVKVGLNHFTYAPMILAAAQGTKAPPPTNGGS